MSSLPAIIPEGKLEALALISSHELRMKDAEELAQTAADHHGIMFQVFKVTERAEGVYRPKGQANGTLPFMAAKDSGSPEPQSGADRAETLDPYGTTDD